ncbi:MAG: xylose ABC transporter ATP-binding protein [Clostridia bacterium]|nr:xylose ABC transporter ATP-binding protein [Clostridia bacterium]
MGSECILEMVDIVKAFHSVKALDGVSFKVNRGEIHALVGENGAGKSTLMKVLSGVYPFGTYQGQIYINGIEQKFHNTKEAENAGVNIIYQELSLARNLSVAENLFIGNELIKNFLIDWDEMYKSAKELLEKVNLYISPETIVGKLGIGHQQLVEIAKALRGSNSILVLDEPTSALAQSEVENLMNLLMTLREQGVTCIYISHRLEEIFKIADRLTVLRDGKTIGTYEVKNLNEESVINLMVGRNLTERYPKKEHERKELIFEVRNFSVKDINENKEVIRDVNFKLYRGEILGIAGLMGAGRTELVNSIFGAFPGVKSGEIYLNGDKIEIASPKDAIEKGIALITEDRKNFGIIATASIRENMSIASLGKISGTLTLDETDERILCNGFVKSLKIKLGSVENKITSLSGGNQQKVILGRWLMTEPKVLILDEPTRGIDVGAKFEIYNIMNELIEQGVGIIMISSELPEILGMSDRILVMHDGRISGELLREEATQERIMNYAMGGLMK